MANHRQNQSRRSMLGLIGTVPLAASGVAAAAASARASAGAEPGRATGPFKGLREYDRYIAGLAAKDEFSGTVLIAHRGHHVLARAYGMADKERRVPNRVDTIYNLASASKPFTALAIVKLVQMGRLEFRTKVGDLLDGFRPEVADHVTVHQLLTHTSGLTNHAGDGPPTDPADEITYSRTERWEQANALARKAKLLFTPGTEHSYSSVGMEILGEIVAAASGRPFWDFVEEHVFETARMTASAYCTRTDWLKNEQIAHPYMYQKDGTRIDAVRNLEAGAVFGGPGTNAARGFIGTGGGGGFSNAPDLVRFALALQKALERPFRDGDLLEPSYAELYIGAKFPAKRREGGTPDAAQQEAYTAYGLVHGIHAHQRIVGHGGGIGGGNTNWSVYLDTDWVGVILSNYDYGDRFQDIIAHERRAVTDGGGR